MPPVRFLGRNNDFDVERAITAMILCPTLEDAVNVLKLQGVATTVQHVEVWRDRDRAIRDRYGMRRQELAPQLEGRLANDPLDNARRASAVTTVAIEKTRELLRLEFGVGANWVRKAVAIFPWWGWILIVVFVVAALSLAFVPTSQVEAFGGDGGEYQLLARNLVHHGVFSESVLPPYYESVVRSPGYPAFLALLDWLGGSPVVVVQAAQFAVIAVMAIVVGLIGREMIGPAVGTLAGVLCATYLPFLEFATRFLTEDLGSLCLAVVVLLLLVARRSDRVVLYGAAGLTLAVLTYVRPEFILLVIPITAILVATRSGTPWRSVERWSRGLTFTAVFIAALVPWTIRNAAVTHGRVLPMAATSGSDLLASADQYDGFITYKITLADWHRYLTQAAEIAPIPAQGFDANAQVRWDQKLRSAAIRIFKSLSLGEVMRSLPMRIAYLWGTADIPPPGRWTSVAHRLAQLQYAVLVLLGLVGFAIRRRQLLRDWPLWIAAAYLSIIHLVFHIEGRYTLPARPMLMVYSAIAVRALVSLVQRKGLTDRPVPTSTISN